MNMLSEMIGQRVECKIHGGFWHLDLVAYDVDTATVEIPDLNRVRNGKPSHRTLPVVAADGHRGVENCVIAPAVWTA